MQVRSAGDQSNFSRTHSRTSTWSSTHNCRKLSGPSYGTCTLSSRPRESQCRLRYTALRRLVAFENLAHQTAIRLTDPEFTTREICSTSATYGHWQQRLYSSRMHLAAGRSRSAPFVPRPALRQLPERLHCADCRMAKASSNPRSRCPRCLRPPSPGSTTSPS